MSVARVISVNVGELKPLRYGDRQVMSGIFKSPVNAALRLEALGFQEDHQADRRCHGGPDKALNVYASENLAYWSERLGTPLTPGAFGENLTTEGISETEIAIGDVFRIGTAVVEVTQPRQPCRTLAERHGERMLAKWVEETCMTGFYVRCLEPGEIQAGDRIERIARDTNLVTIAEAMRIMHARHDREAAERLLAIRALSEAWRADLAPRLR